MKTVFTPSQFVPTKWNSAEDKAKFANHFVRFVESGFKKSLFQKWFYTRLSMTFGHIAHYNQGGFWAEFFETTSDQLRFLEQTTQCMCHGDPEYTYSDVEKAIRNWLVQTDIVPDLVMKELRERQSSERAEYARLQKIYG
jgi:hypothetical protein